MKKESPVRSIVNSLSNQNYTSANSLAEAKNKKNYYLVMEGDCGGQIYLTCPVNLIKCSECILYEILIAIDKNQWPENDISMRNIFYEPFELNQGVLGGMGGGIVLEKEIWIHPNLNFSKELLKKAIFQKKEKQTMNELKKLLEANK